MPKLTANKDDIKGMPLLPEGMYTVRLDGFEPKKSKGGGSILLGPVMKVINDPTFNDQRVFDNINTGGKFVWVDFCHCFGVPLVEDASGNVEWPGDFAGPDDDPTKWQYTGPLLGQVGQVYVVQSEYNGKPNNKVKFFVCKIGPTCTHKHSSNLAK
jgi:hypothetical protein